MAETRPYYVPWALIASGVLAKLSPRACKLFLALAAHDNPQREVFVSVPRLVAECQMDIRHVQRAAKELTTAGVIRVTPRPGDTSLYLLLPPPADFAVGANPAVGADSVVGAKSVGGVGADFAGGVGADFAGVTYSTDHAAEKIQQDRPPSAASVAPAGGVGSGSSTLIAGSSGSSTAGSATPTAGLSSPQDHPQPSVASQATPSLSAAGSTQACAGQTSPGDPQEVSQPTATATAAGSTSPVPRGTRRRKGEAKPAKAKRTDAEIQEILTNPAARLAYLKQGSMRFFTDEAANVINPNLTAPMMAGGYWYFVAQAREFTGTTPAVESLPDGALIGKISRAMATTPAATLWGWLGEAVGNWSVAHRSIDIPITPDLVLQPWYREKLTKAAANAAANAECDDTYPFEH